jgi:hypothetical protein
MMVCILLHVQKHKYQECMKNHEEEDIEAYFQSNTVLFNASNWMASWKTNWRMCDFSFANDKHIAWVSNPNKDWWYISLSNYDTPRLLPWVSYNLIFKGRFTKWHEDVWRLIWSNNFGFCKCIDVYWKFSNLDSFRITQICG